jgi:hypothetical protein
MRAFILRRVDLLERGVGPIRGRQIINDLDLPPEDLPLLICACGR